MSWGWFGSPLGDLQGPGFNLFGWTVGFGSGGEDTLHGDGAGALDAGAAMGDDVLFGLAGADLIVGDAERLVPAPGESAATSPAAHAGDDLLFGGDGDDVIYGDFAVDPSALHEVSLGDDVIYGGAGDDVIYTDAVGVLADAAGNNVAFGGDGDDALRGGEGVDLLYGGDGDDVLYADGQSGTAPGATPTVNRLDGGRGDDRAYGGDGDDRLLGGRGDDVLGGGRGDDRLIGGEGADEFEYFMGDGADRVVDFAPGEDRLVLVSDFGDPLPAADAAGLMALAVAQGRDLVFDLGGGSVLTLAGTAAEDLSATDFLILA